MNLFRSNPRATLDDEYMKGKVVVVTGGASGIGLHTAKILVAQGCVVIFTSRALEKGLAAKKSILQLLKEERSFTQEQIQDADRRLFAFEMELTCHDSVRRFVDDFHSLNLGKLDILINNAGLMYRQWEDVQAYHEGTYSRNCERHFAANVLGHVLLTDLLIDDLKQSEDPRVINLSSPSHRYVSAETVQQPISEMALMSSFVQTKEGQATGMLSTLTVYGFSKLCNVWHAMYIHREYFGKYGIRADIVQPVVVESAIQDEWIKGTLITNRFVASILSWLAGRESADQGAQSTVHVANLKNSGEESSGHLCQWCRLRDDLLHTEARNEAKQDELMGLCRELYRQQNHVGRQCVSDLVWVKYA